MNRENSQEQMEKELWQQVAESEGAKRAEAYFYLSRISFEKGKFKDSLAMCETARELFETEVGNDYRLELYEVNMAASRIHVELGQRLEAAEALGKAIEAAKGFDIELVPDLLRDQGRHFYSADEFEKSMHCHHQAIALTDQLAQDRSLGIDYLNIGMCLHQLQQLHDAVEKLKQARRYFKEDKDFDDLAFCDGEIAEIYVELAYGPHILKYGQRALDFFTTVRDYRRMWWLQYYIGIAWRIQDDQDLALEHLEAAKELAHEQGRQPWEFFVKVEKEIAEILIIKGRVHEGQEILRRIRSVEGITESEATHEAA